MARIGPGVHVALITPLDDAGGLAEAALEALFGRLADAGLAGISVLGSTGEYTSLPEQVRAHLMRAVRSLAGPGVALTAGVIEPSLDRAREAAEAAAAAGMDAILLAPPFYYPMTATEIAGFYGAMAEASPLPVVMYNIPPLTKVSIPVGVVSDLAAHPNVIAIKDSGGDQRYFQQCAAFTRGRDFLCFTGSDDLLLASLAAGGHGTICASANAVPGAAVELMRCWGAGDLAGALAVQRRLARLVAEIRALGGHRAWKAAVELLGVTPCRVAAPYRDLPAADRQRVAAALADWQDGERI